MIQINPEIEKKYSLENAVSESIIKNRVENIDAFIDNCEKIDEYISIIHKSCSEMEEKWQLKFEPANSIPKRIRRKLQHILFSSFIRQQNDFNSELKEAVANIGELQKIIALDLRKMEKKGE
ncbi:MAG: hypothetical protein II098_03400 [Treponema sp.]|nr:hypothetical protein [Treponema sp.]